MEEKESGILDSKTAFKATRIWNDLIEHLHSNVSCRKHRYKMRLYESCFTGEDVLNTLQPYIEDHPDLHRSPSRDKVKTLCQRLLDNHVFEAVVVSDAKRGLFEAGKLYRFLDSGCEISENLDTSNVIHCEPERPKNQRPSNMMDETDVLKIRREVAICRLCQLVDVPFLEEVLEGHNSSSNSGADSFQVVPDVSELMSPRTSLLQKTIDSCVSSNERTWLEAAKRCLNLQRHFPLPMNKEIGFLNVSCHTRLGIFHSFSGFYNSLLEPLIPSYLVDIVCGIMVASSKQNFTETLEAMQLLMILVPLERQKHLRELLAFMKTSIICELDLGCEVDLDAAVYQAFKMAVFPSKVTQMSGAEKLLSFMIEHVQSLFMNPEDFDQVVQQYLNQAQSDENFLPTWTACKQMSTEAFEKEGVHQTDACLEELINSIMDDLKMSLREKKQRMKAFQKHHPHIFHKYFPEGNL